LITLHAYDLYVTNQDNVCPAGNSRKDQLYSGQERHRGSHDQRGVIYLPVQDGSFRNLIAGLGLPIRY